MRETCNSHCFFSLLPSSLSLSFARSLTLSSSVGPYGIRATNRLSPSRCKSRAGAGARSNFRAECAKLLARKGPQRLVIVARYYLPDRDYLVPSFPRDIRRAGQHQRTSSSLPPSIAPAVLPRRVRNGKTSRASCNIERVSRDKVTAIPRGIIDPREFHRESEGRGAFFPSSRARWRRTHGDSNSDALNRNLDR